MNAIDTNIFVYALQVDDPAKATVAMGLLEKLDPTDTILLWQVLCECSAVFEKLRRGRNPQLDPVAITNAIRQ